MTYSQSLVCLVNAEEGIIRHNDSTHGKIASATVIVSTNLESNKFEFIGEIH
jgi:hypothetical protein